MSTPADACALPAPPPPRALLFDIGGVCVLSPFQAILDYEIEHRIPPGWINVAISGSKPDGAWHRMERGELPLGDEFYAQFWKDLRSEQLWHAYCKRFADKMAARGKPLSDTALPLPLPDIDVRYLLDAILRISSTPDPYMLPALKKLKASRRFVLAALSNTMALPDDHFAAQIRTDGSDVRAYFDPFVSSAHAGVRKPERRAFELAMELMRQAHKQQFPDEAELQPASVIFLDDIGENLKAGRSFGFRTIKVQLGDVQAAVKSLGVAVGMDLLAPEESGSKL